MRVHKLQNVENALNFLKKVKKIKLVNIRNDEIVDGNPKLILGLLWTLILHFQVHSNVCSVSTPPWAAIVELGGFFSYRI